MKDFFKTVLAVIVGFLILNILASIMFFMMFGAMAALGSSKTVLPREGVLDLDMSKFTLAEQTKTDNFDLSALQGFNTQMNPSLGIMDAVKALEIAADDPGIKYVFLRADRMSAGMAGLEEFRKALVAFHESGKPVIAYTDGLSAGSFYIASAADKVYMNSDCGAGGMLLGISGRMTFIKDLLDKFGVNVQLIRHGKYKSAGEMFIRNSPSEANMEQNQVMISSIWKSLSSEMAAARGIDEEQFNALIDGLTLVIPKDFKEAGLVDELFNRQQLIDKLCELAGISDEKDLHLVPMMDYVEAKIQPVLPTGKNLVAVIYAEGNIVDGAEKKDIAGDRFARIIAKVRKDKNVKAVVLRVNSPGGSVLASAKIKDELDLLKAEKPLVASYGDYAASGGYWISNGCEKIYSDAVTLTGSIGVFSMIPDLSKTIKDVAHINITPVKSNKHSDMMSLMRPFDDDEKAYMQASIEDIYSNFVRIVSEGRSLTQEHVDSVAQGRVWTGSDALGIGLVDEIGTLQDAILYAASLAGYQTDKEYKVIGYPRPLTMMEQVMESLSGATDDGLTAALKGTSFEGIASAVKALKANEPAKAYALMPYDITIEK